MRSTRRDPMIPPIATAAQVRHWAQLGSTSFSPLGDSIALVWQADVSGFDEGESLRVADWLRTLPCPVIGVGASDHRDPCVRACDVLLDDPASADALLANVSRSPIAAAVLVQLLRIVERLPLADALIAESLAYASLQAGPEFHRWLTARPPATTRTAADPGPAVVLEREGERLSVELNRPALHNSMSVEMRDALVEALQLLIADSSIRLARISGRGRCFSTGGDLAEFGTAPDPATAHIVRSLSVPGRFLAPCADRVEVHLQGACIGSGIEFPVFAGRVIAAADAWFQLPELRFGLMPGAGGCVSIPRRIGRQRTAWLALSGKRINVHTALEWGLVDAIA